MQTKEQNRTRDTEIRKKLTVTRGRGRGMGITGKQGEGFSRNMYKVHMDKAQEG